ncbi:low temperature requirement protein A [Nocardia sp. NPDC004068]|uniref:low temperature requirement protein A n=1 Tax=Nocardia sp. NPDC004068 TaxID=3364303 RepID=UPI0036C28EDE
MARATRREVSPLELFFDLVFVLAVGQLTHHLTAQLSWRGAAETLVALIAVCGVWAFTSFEVTLLDIERRATRAVTLAVMGLALFMNAGIAHAFDDGSWLFVVPMLVALGGPAGYAAVSAPTPELRTHFRHVLVWFAISAPLWIIGAAVDSEIRLYLWFAAALIDLLGTWTAHPVRGSVRTARLPFDAEHMLERMRLFLIILLGETVLTLGRVIADHRRDPVTLVLALGCAAALVCLWAVYFGRSEQLVVTHAVEIENPIRAVHVGINAIYGVVAGLVLFATGSELLLAHTTTRSAGVPGVLVLAGPALYLLSQAIYFRWEMGIGWRIRLIGAAALGVGAAVAYWLPTYLVVVVLVAILLALAVHISGRTPAPN